MEKKLVKLVLTGGPAGGKTSMLARIREEVSKLEDWRVITVPESASDLISNFGIKPFDDCLQMREFQDYVVADQLHKELLACKAARTVRESNVLIVYDRALLDDLAYVTPEEFASVLAGFGLTVCEALAKYDAVIHMVTCAKGALHAYNLDNAARTESPEEAVARDERTLQAWSDHPVLTVLHNNTDFETKLQRGMREVFRIVGLPAQG